MTRSKPSDRHGAPAFDHVIRGGRVVTEAAVMAADVGIRAGRIVALGEGLGPGADETDARGHLVLPGGVDSHAHIEQLTAAGILNADTWESATRAAARGGTTSVIAFAAQHVGTELPAVLADYGALAAKGAIIDYAFHIIVADPTDALIRDHLPAALKAGHASIKLFMTYDRLKVADEGVLDVLAVARDHQAMVCVHAENHAMIAWMVKRLIGRGHTAPKFHALSHPRLAETEAFERMIRLAALVDQPIMLFHVSTAEGAGIIRRARGEGLKVYGETCPQYLLMTATDLDRPGQTGAKWMCSPPQRGPQDVKALWHALALGDLQTVSSDHAPFRFDATGKLRAGPEATFKQMANGMPGLEERLPVLFDAMVSKAAPADRDDALMAFARITAGEPARLYNLKGKGAIAVGADADLAIWDPRARRTLDDDEAASLAGYTPFAGRTVKGWPVLVMRRGAVIVREDSVRAEAGSGRFVARADGGPAAKPTGRLQPELDPRLNGGVALL
jgi:dihydropyrimidinase